MEIKKILLSIMTITLFSLGTVQVQAGSWGMGIQFQNLDLTTDASDDIDNNGSVDTTKSFDDSVTVPAIFVEKNFDAFFGNLALGVSYIPFEADIDKRSITQSELGDEDDSASTGTNSVEGTVSDHMTIYFQPGYMIDDNTMLYGTFGFASATVNGKSKSITHTNINKDVDLDGTKVGVGIKKVFDSGLFVKADYSETSYDTISFTTSNSTKATADLDNTAMALSIGKQF